MPDYETLRLIWWALLGLLLIGFAVTDGFDLGVAALLPFVARTEVERRMAINSIAPTWEGNQVWFILGGGAIFAAWPFVYAVSFSGFYLAMFAVLAALILRPVGFKYRSKRPDPAWRGRWDWALFVGGLVPALVFGVAVGNVLTGVPFRLDADLRASYEGGFLDLFGPFALVSGLLSVAMLVLHGAAWLAIKVERGPVQDRARTFGLVAGLAALLLFAVGSLLVAGLPGWRLVGAVDPSGPSNPLRSTAEAVQGVWLLNYGRYPWMLIAPALGFCGTALAMTGIAARRGALAFAGSSLGAAGIIATVGCSMFPFLLPSSIDAHSSLTVWKRVFERADAGHYAGRDGRLPADRAGLHRLGLPHHVRPGHGGAGRDQPRLLLRRTRHVVFCLDTRPRSRGRVRHPQWHLARVPSAGGRIVWRRVKSGRRFGRRYVTIPITPPAAKP